MPQYRKLSIKKRVIQLIIFTVVAFFFWTYSIGTPFLIIGGIAANIVQVICIISIKNTLKAKKIIKDKFGITV